MGRGATAEWPGRVGVWDRADGKVGLAKIRSNLAKPTSPRCEAVAEPRGYSRFIMFHLVSLSFTGTQLYAFARQGRAFHLEAAFVIKEAFYLEGIAVARK